MGFDTTILNALETIRSAQLTNMFMAVTFFGGAITITLLTAAVAMWLYRRGDTRLSLLFILFNATNGLITFILKNFLHRSRPDPLESLIQPGGFSLPSGHASSSLLLYGMIAFLLLRTVKNPQSRFALILASALFIFSIGVSRLYLGVHYPTDVLIGFGIGGLMLWLFIRLAKRHNR